jgi:oxygen-independent coproporphyrinogen-3 oxidase
VDAVLAELGMWQDSPAWDEARSLATLYFGGGTPSLLAVDDFARLIDGILSGHPLESGAEVTLEANPDDVTPALARAWVDRGVNRVSLGVQSFDDAVLAWMHRSHGAGEVARAVAVLRSAGIARVSVDLIFGLPVALGRDWAADLDQALQLEPDHVSLYGLTVEDRTPLARWVGRGIAAVPPEARYAAEFLEANQVLEAAGFEHYEVSNAGRPGKRARHNQAYWRRASYIGLGPSAHSAWGSHRQWNVRDWAAYQSRMADERSPIAGTEDLGPEAVALEDVYLGLRTIEGVVSERLPAALRDRWVGQGWARERQDRLVLRPEGWLRLDALVGEVSPP